MNKYTILISQTIEEAIKLLTDNKIKILVVLNENKEVVGTVTDGDIRRGFLNKLSMKSKVQTILNSDPIVCAEGTSRTKLIELMRKHNIMQIPIVDETRRFVRVELFFNLINHSKKENKVIIMAGGLGTRLKPLTNNIPKPMLKVGNKPILEIIINNLVKYGFTDITISVNYKADLIKEYFDDGIDFGAKIEYIEETKRLGTAGALSLLPYKIDKPFIVMNSDLLTTINFEKLLKKHEEFTAKATMCIKEYDIEIPYGVINIDSEDSIVSIDEKPMHTFFINTGVYVLNSEVLKYIPDNTYYDMPSLFSDLKEKEFKISTYKVDEYWLDIGKLKDYEQAQEDYLKIF